MKKDLWFPREDYLARLAKVQSEMRAAGLDILLAFHPESVTYLTGFFTAGYLSFQCAIVPVDGEPTVVCRDVEEYELERTAAFEKRVLWSDSEDPKAVAVGALKRIGADGARIAIEKASWQLNAQRYDAITAGLPCAAFHDAGHLVARLRMLKSPAEVAYQSRAARAAEAAMEAAVDAAKEGATEREVAAAIASATVRAGSDRADPGAVSSGERALLVHGRYSDRVLEAGDTLHLEPIPCVRFYHARFMRTIKIGRATSDEHRFAEALISLQDRAMAQVRPGVPAEVPDGIYREGILGTGLVTKYTNKTFYGVGLHFPPNGGEFLEAAPGCTWRFESGMTFHTYLSVRGFAFSETILVTDDGYTPLTHYPRRLIVS